MTLRTLILALALAASGAQADDLPSDLVRAEVLGGWRTADGTHMAALRLTLADGWKTYWRAPGDAGIPPQFDWKGSANLGAVAFHWPKPEIFDIGGMRTLGYRHELVLPIEIRPLDPEKPVSLRAEVDLGVCRDVCVPVELDLSAKLPEVGAPDGLIRDALASQPQPAETAGLTGVDCSVEPLRDGLRVEARLAMPPLGADEFAVLELPGTSVWVSEAVMARHGGVLSATADLVPANAQPFLLDRSALRITVFGDHGRAVEVRGCRG